MSETSNIAGMKVFGVTPDQVARIVTGLESAGVGPIEMPDTSHAPRLEDTRHTCITGTCYFDEGKCFANAAETVLATSAVRYNIHYCPGGHCHKEY